ncbi:MAG: zinc finger domain-containing protein [Candidatus Nanopelagicales bacterium]
MLEIPEAVVTAGQMAATLRGRTVASVVAAHTPHRFAFFNGDPDSYDGVLRGQVLADARAVGGMVEILLGGTSLLVNDGVNLRCHEPGAVTPRKHQLLVGFSDGSTLSATVRMYGSLLCYPTGTCDNPYYAVALAKPSPLTAAFDAAHFDALLAPAEVQKLSIKAALATEQRIPGLGNGVLQDILWTARLHPRRKVSTLDRAEVVRLHATIVELLATMAAMGGRDTESDLFGQPGGYQTVMSRLHVGEPCPACGTPRVKEAFLGGSVHYCPGCQQL